MSKKIWGLPVSTPLNPAKIDPVVPDDKLANAVSAYMDANPITPSGIGARPDTWTPTAAEVGATPASHAEDKNNPHSVTIAQIGAAPASHVENKNNPHAVTAAQIGLGNVDNTADKDKPVSTAQATAIAEAKKAGTDAQAAAATAQNSANNANTAVAEHAENKDNPHEVTCAQIGAASLGYADTKTSMTLLWENASPTSAFAAQTIAIDLSGYDMIEVFARSSTGAIQENAWGSVAYSKAPGLGRLYTTNVFMYMREFTVGESWITFADNMQFKTYGSAGTAANTATIPHKIYGIKGVIGEPSKEILSFGNVTLVNGYYVNYTTGNHATQTGTSATLDYIPVEPGMTYQLSYTGSVTDFDCNMCFYDADKKYTYNGDSSSSDYYVKGGTYALLKRIPPITFTVPGGCYYMRFQSNKSTTINDWKLYKLVG